MMVPGEWGPALKSFGSSVAAQSWDSSRNIFNDPRVRREDVTIAEFVKDHFRRNHAGVRHRAAIIRRVYGGQAGKLSARSVLPRFVGYEQKYGSLIRGVRRESGEKRRSRSSGAACSAGSFRKGMQTLVDMLSGCARKGASADRPRSSRHCGTGRAGGNWRVRVGDSFEEAAQIS